MALLIEGLEKGPPVMWAGGPSDPAPDQHCAQMLDTRLLFDSLACRRSMRALAVRAARTKRKNAVNMVVVGEMRLTIDREVWQNR